MPDLSSFPEPCVARLRHSRFRLTSLASQIPMMPGVTSNLEARRIALIHKRLVSAQTTERLARRECALPWFGGGAHARGLGGSSLSFGPVTCACVCDRTRSQLLFAHAIAPRSFRLAHSVRRRQLCAGPGLTSRAKLPLPPADTPRTDAELTHARTVLPQILEDSRRTLDSWEFSGTFDPFERLPEVRAALPD